MLWVLVSNNIYLYELNFGSFYRNPTILEMDSIAGNFVNMDLIENLFLNWNTMTEDNSSTGECLWITDYQNSQRQEKVQQHWPPTPLASCQHVGAWVDSVCMSAHSRQSERQNIIDRRHAWQQCLITISEGISTTKIWLNSRKDCTMRHR